MARNYSSTAADTTLSGSITGSATTMTVSATTGFPAAPFVLAVDAGAATQELVLVTNVAGTTLTVTRGYDSTVATSHDTGAVVRHSHAAIDFREAAPDYQASLAQTLTNKTLALGSNTVSGTLGQFNTAVTDADLASLAGAETLTNKTLASPTITGIGSTTYVRKPSVLAVSSSTTYVNDPDLTVAVVANATYEVYIACGFQSSEGGYRARFNFPPSSTVTSRVGFPTSTAFDFVVDGGVGGPFPKNTAFDLQCVVKVAGTAGNIFVQFTQYTSHSNTSYLWNDSIMIVRRIA